MKVYITAIVVVAAGMWGLLEAQGATKHVIPATQGQLQENASWDAQTRYMLLIMRLREERRHLLTIPEENSEERLRTQEVIEHLRREIEHLELTKAS